MMNKLNRFLIIALSCIMVTGFSCISFAADSSMDDAGITYTITVYSGDSGTFSDGSTVKKFEGRKLGDEITLDVLTDGSSIKPTVNKDVSDKYYVRGLTVAGHDNDEVSRLQLVRFNYTVEGDQSFTVAYGIQGDIVRYTVNYVDENGAELAPSETYYGMIGDTPVMSYRWIDGYTPKVRNLGVTLTSDPANNVFNFEYVAGADNGGDDNTNPNPGGGGNTNQNPGGGGTNAGDANANANANANPGTTGINIADSDTPQAGPNDVTIEDNTTPLVVEPDESKTKNQLTFMKAIIMAAAGIILMLLLLWLLFFKRRSEKKEENA